MSAAWSTAKIVWGVLITVATVVIAFGQYYALALTVRPSILVQLAPAPEAAQRKYGPASHTLTLHNLGTVKAEGVLLNVRTRHAGRTIHEDRAEKLGVLVPKQQQSYVVFVHDDDLAALDLAAHQLLEEFELTYRSRNVLRFWCDTVYAYRITYVYKPEARRWAPHPLGAPQEIETCG